MKLVQTFLIFLSVGFVSLISSEAAPKPWLKITLSLSDGSCDDKDPARKSSKNQDKEIKAEKGGAVNLERPDSKKHFVIEFKNVSGSEKSFVMPDCTLIGALIVTTKDGKVYRLKHDRYLLHDIGLVYIKPRKFKAGASFSMKIDLESMRVVERMDLKSPLESIGNIPLDELSCVDRGHVQVRIPVDSSKESVLVKSNTISLLPHRASKNAISLLPHRSSYGGQPVIRPKE